MREHQDYRCGICRIHETDIDLSGVGGRPRKDGQQLDLVPLAAEVRAGSRSLR